MKKLLGRIIGIVFLLILSFQQYCYADVLVDHEFDNYLLDLYKNQINSTSNSTYSNTSNPNDTDLPKSLKKRHNKNLLMFLIYGVLVILVVGISLVFLIKSKKKE